MAIDWKSHESAADVQQILENYLPKMATIDDVRSFTIKEGLECSELVESTIYCSAPAKSRWFFVKAKWLIQFLFRETNLVKIEVKQGFIGP